MKFKNSIKQYVNSNSWFVIGCVTLGFFLIALIIPSRYVELYTLIFIILYGVFVWNFAERKNNKSLSDILSDITNKKLFFMIGVLFIIVILFTFGFLYMLQEFAIQIDFLTESNKVLLEKLEKLSQLK